MSKKHRTPKSKTPRTPAGAEKTAEPPAAVASAPSPLPSTALVAPEFAGVLLELALSTFREWLEENHVHPDAVRMVSCIDVLACYLQLEQGGYPPDKIVKLAVSDTVIDTINIVAAMGGQFVGMDAISKPRESLPLRAS